MSSFLIALVVLGYLGGSSSIIAFTLHEGRSQYDMILLMFFISILNAWCARYLYKKASKNKTECAFFAFFGNINAIFVHCLSVSAKGQWKEGRHFLAGNECTG